MGLIIAYSSQAANFNWHPVASTIDGAELFVDLKSLKTLMGNKRAVVELLNYRDAQGKPRSIVSGSIYDCNRQHKLDQFVTMYEDHWGEGQVSDQSRGDTNWYQLKPSSVGMGVHQFVCVTHKVDPI